MWPDHRFARTGTTRIIRMRVRPTGITVRAGLWVECLSARARGITGGGTLIMDSRATAAGTTDMRQSLAAVSTDVVRSRAPTAADSTVEVVSTVADTGNELPYMGRATAGTKLPAVFLWFSLA